MTGALGMAATLASACAAILAVCVAVIGVRWALNRWRYRKIPGPFAPPVLGNLPGLARHSGGLHEYLDYCRRKYGRLFKVYLGSRMFIIVADPDMARRVQYKLLNHDKAIGVQLTSDKKAADPSASRGLFVARDDEWRALRMAWQPAFSSASLEGYAALMDGCALKLCDALQGAAVEGRLVDVWREVGRMTLSVVGSCAYGVDFHTMSSAPHGAIADPEAHALVTAVQRFFASGLLSGTTWGRLLLLFPDAKGLVQWLAAAMPDQALRDLTEARQTVVSTSRKLVNAWREANGCPTTASRDAHAAASTQRGRGAGGMSKPSAAGRGATGIAPGSFLGLMLDNARSTKEFDDTTVIAQSNGFILAGYETTANTLAYAIWAISAHPRVQERVLAEVDAFGRCRDVTHADLQGAAAFPYLQATLKETMRMFPAASMTHRDVTKEEGFELAPGIRVPKGVLLHTAMWCYQRDEAFWPRPLEFMPERFLPEGSAFAATNENALTPFGGGARLCVGYKFAQQEALITLVRLYQRMTFELQPGMVPLRLRQNLTLCPRDGVIARPVLRC